MRKLYILLLLTFGSLVAALAQPTISIGDGEGGCTNDQICLPVTTDNFTNINSLRFSFTHDPAVMSFAFAQNFHPDMVAPMGNLGPALFTEAPLGQVSFATWETGACDSPGNIGVTLDDGEVLFEMCYTAVGNYGDQTEVAIGNTPTPIRVTRNATLCNNIGLITETGAVTLCVRELNITAVDVSGNEGDQVCVDFDVTGFDALSGVQYTVNYDCNFLEFVSLIPNSDLPNNTLAGTYGLPGDIDEECAITVAWSYFVPGEDQPSLPDGETMFTVCFDILGDCETDTQVTFSNTPTAIEAFNQDPDNPSEIDAVPFTQTPGTVSVNDCNPTGLEILINCGAPVEINEEFCVSFSAGNNFDQVRDLLYLMQWNADILEFVSVNDPNNLFQLTGVNFDTNNVDNGILGLDWSVSGPSQNLDNMELIYNVCFRVIGLGGDSPIQIVPPGEATVDGNQLDINSSNCVVEVIQPPSVGLNFGDMAAPLGSTDCVPITVTNFTEVTSMQYSLVWDESIWTFQNVANVNPLINGAVFTPIGLSSLTFDWADVGGVTLPNDAVLFEVCYEAIGVPGPCDVLATGGFPLAERATTSTSNGEDVGLVINTAEMCVLFPEGFGLTAEPLTAGWKDTVCMDFTVESFDNITVADFFVHFDPTVLEFVSATPLAWTGLELTDPSPAGTIPAHFDNATPVVLADGTAAFEVCFVLIGDPEECYDVTIEDDPAEAVMTTVGEGSIVITDGEICVEDQIVIQDIIISPASCPGVCDGTVTIVVCEWPGQGFIGTTWHTEPNDQFTPLFLDGVCEDTLIFTVFDNSSGVSLRDTIIIPVGGTIPAAVIEGDEIRNLACDPPQIFLNAEDNGENISFAWFINTVFTTPEGDGSSLLASTPGNYILQVTDNVSGCTSTDTVVVDPPVLPAAMAGDDPAIGITCNNPCITLNGMGTGDNLTFSWDVVGNTDPENMDPTTVNTPDLIVCGPGVYRLTVRDGVSGCEATDDVAVSDDSIYPNACLDPETGGDMTLEQNCDGVPVVFDASCSENTGLDVTYQWYNEDFTPSTSGLTNSYTDLGSYPLVVTEMTTGCMDTVYAHVVENSNAPEVTLDPVGAIDCNVDSIMLNATVTPDDNPALQILWTLTDGATFSPNGMEDGPTPTALTPGTYQILVTNTDNNCEAEASVTIVDQTAAPIASIINDPADLILDCNNTSVLLDGTASSQGDTISYQWYLDDVAVSPMGDADTLIVSMEGEYILEVINETTGCTAADTVVVTQEQETPQIILSNSTATIDCATPTVSVTATINGAPNFTFQGWTVIDGNILSASADSLMITVDAAGIYNIQVTSDLSGCLAEADFVVNENLTLPIATVTTDTLSLTCLEDFVTLDGTGSSDGTNFVYTWENLSGPIQPDMPNLIQTNVAEAGTYQLTVLNGDNNCSSDTIMVVVTDTIAPVGMIAEVEDLTCLDMTRDITVVVTEADQYTVTWSAGTTPGTGETVSISEVGTYTATIVNTETGCIGTAEIMVNGDTATPTIDLGLLPEFDCADLTVQIDASGSGATEDFTITWSGDGTITPATGTLMVEVDNIGSYTLSLTSIANGCTADSTFTIGTVDELNIPEVIIADPTDLPCDGTAVTLDGSATGDAADFASTVWTDATSAVVGNNLTVDVTAVGEYTLTIISNTPAACENSASVTVNPDPNTPMIDLGVLPEFDCDDLTVTIDASASGAEADFSDIQWTSSTGGTITPANGSLTVEVDNIGEYTLSLTLAANGCSVDSTFMIVAIANPTLPTVVITDPTDLGCDGTPVVLDGSGSGDAADFVSTIWTDADATTIANTLVTQTTEIGEYTLTVVAIGPLACENSASVTVVPDANTPVADAGMDIILSCEGIGSATLDGSNSLPAPSATVTYEWLTLAGSAALEGDLTGSMPTLTGAGQYQIIVTNTVNGCIDTSDVVTVTLELPADADAGADFAACDDFAELDAVAVSGTQGIWTTSSGAIIDIEFDPATPVSGLVAGQNVFTWTLSAPNCPDYSSADVIVTQTTGITANDDILDIIDGEREGMISIIDNDQLGGSSQFDITVLTAPGFGTYDTTAFGLGTLDLSLGLSDFGVTEMVYQICSTDCPNLCDTATIFINVAIDGDFFVPNAITPNDDGQNDELIFDVLLFTDEKDLPDNELIIFSRWGDIIYESKPYNNDWTGLNKEGKPVPEGTYYYILRMNIGQGEILRGDVTVIR